MEGGRGDVSGVAEDIAKQGLISVMPYVIMPHNFCPLSSVPSLPLSGLEGPERTPGGAEETRRSLLPRTFWFLSGTFFYRKRRTKGGFRTELYVLSLRGFAL